MDSKYTKRQPFFDLNSYFTKIEIVELSNCPTQIFDKLPLHVDSTVLCLNGDPLVFSMERDIPYRDAP